MVQIYFLYTGRRDRLTNITYPISEAIVQEQYINLNSDLADDLNLLQEILQDDEPAYILAKQDHVPQWLLITYVPETARIKDKVGSAVSSLQSVHYLRVINSLRCYTHPRVLP